MCAPEPQMEAGEPSNKSWVVYQLSNLNSIHIWSYLLSPRLPLSAVTPLVESVTVATAGSAQIGCVRLFPWTMVLLLKLPISLSDPPERGTRLCEYILISKNGRALRREREGEKIGRKYDVSKWRAWKKMLHLLEYTLQSFLLSPKLESKD